MSHAVRYEQDGGIVILTLNEPRTRNAISPAIVEAMVECVSRVNADLSVGCVILTGAGEGFSSGGNVKVMKERTGLFGGSPAEIRRSYLQGIQRIPLAMYGLEAPSIAAVNGAAVGAGCDLAGSSIEYSIVLDRVSVRDVRGIHGSLIGRCAEVSGSTGFNSRHRLVIGDDSRVEVAA